MVNARNNGKLVIGLLYEIDIESLIFCQYLGCRPQGLCHDDTVFYMSAGSIPVTLPESVSSHDF